MLERIGDLDTSMFSELSGKRVALRDRDILELGRHAVRSVDLKSKNFSLANLCCLAANIRY